MVDKEIIKDRLSLLEEYILDLEEYRDLTLEEFMEHEKLTLKKKSWIKRKAIINRIKNLERWNPEKY